MSTHTRISVTLLLLAVNIPTLAAEDAVPRPHQGETLTVETIRERGPEAIEAAESVTGLDAVRLGSPNPLMGVSREEFSEWTRNDRLGDIVDRMPGVFSGGDEHLGENKDTRLRGLKHGWTRMEYGGITLPDISPGRDFRLNKVSPLSIGSIVILRSPTPEYDSDGIAGRILLTPRAIPDHTYLEAKVGYGMTTESNSDQDAEAYNVAVATGTRVSEGFGFNIYGSVDRTPVVSYVDTVTRNTAGVVTKEVVSEEDKHWDNANLVTDLGFLYDHGEFRIRPMYLYQNEVRATDALTTNSSGTTSREVTSLDRPQQTYGTTLDHRHHFTDSLELRWDAHYFVATEEKYTDKEVYTNEVFIRTESNQRSITHWVGQFGAKTIYRFEQLCSHELKSGFQVRKRDFDSDYDKWNTSASGVVTDTTNWEDNFILREDYAAAFVQDTMEVTKGLTVMLGARYEYVTTDTESTFNDQTGSSTTSDLNPSMHVLYQIADGLNARASAARSINRPGYRDMAPTSNEGSTTITLGNPDLIPETAWNYEAGLEYGVGRTMLGATVFRKDLENVIEVVDTGVDSGGKDVLQYDNVGDGFVQGIEFDQRLSLRDLNQEWCAVTIWASETFLESEITETRTGITRQLSEQSNVLFGFGADYDIESTGTSFGLGAKYQGESERISSATDTTITDATWYLSAKAEQRIAKQATVALSVDNLLDETIDKHRTTATTTEESTDAVGISAKLSLSMKF